MKRDPRLSDLSLMLVDGTSHWRNLVRHMLHSLGITDIHEEGTGKGGITAIGNYRFNLVLVDFDVAPEGGLGFVRRVRALKPEQQRTLPIIMMCQQPTRSRVIETIAVGANEFVPKPLAPETLQKSLLSLLDNPRRMITVDDYFGPDRRRLNVSFTRNKRRQSDTPSTETPPADAGSS